MQTTGSGINTNKKVAALDDYFSVQFNSRRRVENERFDCKRVENVQRGMSNTNVELKNEKISGKHVFDVKSKTRV